MNDTAPIKKTIALPLAIHKRASELAKKIGLKQYEFITAAILLAEEDEQVLEAILKLHHHRFPYRKVDVKVKKTLENLSQDQLDALLSHLNLK
jgi:hypothetical protein